MAVEVTSVADRRLVWLVFRSIAVVLIIAALIGGAILRRSYLYYSGLIDARLRQGYLTSRPGLYAAPETLRAGQGLSADDLVLKLRRAGYVESCGSDVWNGCFNRLGETIEIQPSAASKSETPVPVLASFQKAKLVELTSYGASLDSFTLEPEVLTNDLSTKPGQRSTLSYNDIPETLVHAILAIEDRRFFQHPGLDPFGVGRALLRNAVDDHLGQGGSTITQQLVKNTYLSPERTFRRKYAEAMLSFALERRLSKQDIFALYCNEIYLGQTGALAVRGIEQAAHVYFAKEPRQLSLAEAATIAGMIQGPARYSPIRNAEAARERRNIVLEAMLSAHWISSDEAAAAMRENVTVAPIGRQDSIAPYYIDYVNRLTAAQSTAPADEQRVYTTIDLDLQKLAETALKRQLDRLDQVYKNSDAKPQAALVALDPYTGNVLAMVGGRDYASSQLNRATDAHRQPGSTFKPFVYAAAFEDGMSPVTMFLDAPQEFLYDRNRTYRPVNFGGGYSMREVTMRSALVQSLNTVTVAVAMRTGLARTANLAQRFGLPRPERYPSLALGTSLATPLELAAAYAAFANGGSKVEPRVVADSSATNQQARPIQVISPNTAYMITNALASVIDHGTARKARGLIKGTAIAGKTGTSRDGWFVGYSPNLVCAVWIGFDDNKQLGLTGAEAALPAWAEFMQAAIARRPELGGKNFLCPEGIKFVEIDNDTGLLSTLTCRNRELIAVDEEVAPHAECYLHGNLPAPRQEESPSLGPPSAIASRERYRPDLASIELRISGSTRVDVDSKGRRTLVNDMR
jgi:penicillin-binding protein 1B